MFIPGFLISIATFPGVVVHELAHVAFCKFTDTRVLEVCYFRVGNPAGYVIHEKPSTVWRHVWIGIGPFFVNTLVGFMIGIVAIPMHIDFDHLTPVQLVLVWLGVSIAMHAFPSTGDAKNIWHAIWSEDVAVSARIIGSPVVGIIMLGAFASIFWLDVLYGLGVVASAGALQNLSSHRGREATFDRPSGGDEPTQSLVADSFRVPRIDASLSVNDPRWSKRRCGDILIETPFSFERRPSLVSASPELAALVISDGFYKGHSAGGTCQVMISRMVYKPGVFPNLDGGVEGMVRRATKGVLGESTPDYTSAHTRVNDLDARRVTWRVTESEMEAIGDALVVQRNQTVWQIIVLHAPYAAKSDVERILSSVHVELPSRR